ncbi:MAG: MATE family efflux transporter [Vicinamibacterales bacterium]
MPPSLHDLRGEFRPMLTLALPVVFAELGWMTMGMVDTLMVGRLSPEAIGAVGLGSSIFFGVCIFAMGLLLGLDTLVSQAFGADDVDACHRWLVHGVVLAVGLSIPVSGLLWWIDSGLDAWGLDPTVLALTRPYLGIVSWSVLPLLLYAAFRRYLQGMGIVRPVMFALLAANVVNVVVNWILIFGNLGAPALGVAGAAWATVFSRVAMMGFLLATILYREREQRRTRAGVTGGVFGALTLEMAWFRRLLALGTPAATQLTLEVGAFAAATALAGRLAPVSLAAHQIAINYAALSFMVPLGIASAGAVRVGHAVGRRDAAGAARAGWTALLFGVLFMSAAAAVFFTVPRLLLRAFTADAGVLEVGVTLLFVAAIFQLFDGVQGVATGALRGLGDTRTPMLWNLAGHWFIGLPLGYSLCFLLGFGVIGLWWGLSLGLMICGVALSIVWARRIHQLERALS